MEPRDVFLLTLFHDPQRSAELRGRLRHIASGKEIAFLEMSGLALALQNIEWTHPTTAAEPPAGEDWQAESKG